MPLIVFEGIDGVGKTTQAAKLIESLRRDRYQPVFVREPGTSMLGDAVRDLIQRTTKRQRGPHASFMLFLAARAQTWDEVVAPALEQGKIVVMDRFIASTAVYQFHARGIVDPVEWQLLDLAHTVICGGRQPDVTLWLDADPLTCWYRAGTRGRDSLDGDVEALEKLRGGYAQEYTRAYENALNVHVPKSVWTAVDASGAIGTVAKIIRERVYEILALS